MVNRVHFFTKLCKFIFKRTIYLSLFIVLLMLTDSQSAFEQTVSSAYSVGMGNAMVATADFPQALYHNPANLPAGNRIETIVSYQNYYQVPGLGQVDVTFCFPLASFPLGIALNRYGNSAYRETCFTIGSAFNLWETARIGVRFQLFDLAIDRYGRSAAWGVSFGLQYPISDDLNIGVVVGNINRPRISRVKEQLPQTMRLGLSYYPAEKITIAFEVFRDIHFRQEYRAGIACQLSPFLSLRAGFEEEMNVYSAGLGFWADTITTGFDYAVRVHQVLGISHVFSLKIDL